MRFRQNHGLIIYHAREYIKHNKEHFIVRREVDECTPTSTLQLSSLAFNLFKRGGEIASPTMILYS